MSVCPPVTVAALAPMPRCATVPGDATRSTSPLPLSPCVLSYDICDPPSAPDCPIRPHTPRQPGPIAPHTPPAPRGTHPCTAAASDRPPSCISATATHLYRVGDMYSHPPPVYRCAARNDRTHMLIPPIAPAHAGTRTRRHQLTHSSQSGFSASPRSAHMCTERARTHAPSRLPA